LYVRVYALKDKEDFEGRDPRDLVAEPPPAIRGEVGAPQSRTLLPKEYIERVVVDRVEDQEIRYLGIVAGYSQPRTKPDAKRVIEVSKVNDVACEAADAANGSGGTHGSSYLVKFALDAIE
jgi:type VI secretion system VasD/TssJ family lipoprotein